MDKQPSVAIAATPIRPDSITWSENNKIAIVALSSIQILVSFDILSLKKIQAQRRQTRVLT